jgi:hypothetical protein
MPTKTRVPNKIIWGLEDIVADVARGETAWSRAMARVRDRFQDPALVLELAEIRDVLASIRSLATEARQGEYRGGGGHND